MRNLYLQLCIGVLLLGVVVRPSDCALPVRLAPKDVPKPAAYSWVSDPYVQLDERTRKTINAVATKLEEDLSDELTVVVIKRMERGWMIDDFAANLIDIWGVGKSTKNNGIVILVATQDREMRIQTGKGARQRLTDSRAERIVQDYMIPKLKENNLDEAVRMGAIVSDDILRGQTNYVNERKETFMFVLIVLAVVGLIVWCVRVENRRNVRRRQFEQRLRRLQEMGGSNAEGQARPASSEPASCCICLEQLPDATENTNQDNPPILTACSHPFHFKCITEWLERSDSCPVCRRTHPLEEQRVPAGNEDQASSSTAPPTPPPRRDQSWFQRMFNRRTPGYPQSYYRPSMFRPFYHRSWGGYCASDWDRMVVLQQQQFNDIQRGYNVTGAGANLQFNRIVPPAATSSSGSRKFGGGSSRGGGGASGRW